MARATEVFMFFAALLLLCPCTPLDEAPKSDAKAPVVADRPIAANSLVSSEPPSAPDPKAEPEPNPGGEPIVPRRTSLPLPAAKGLFLSHYESPRERKLWYTLSAAGHGGAAFDAWSTRRAISSGAGVEANPLLKPFAESNAIYAATQVSPLLMDYLGHRMMFSKRTWVRRLWWVPQVAGASISFSAAIHNVRIAR
jgi:hypothetical protein